MWLGTEKTADTKQDKENVHYNHTLIEKCVGLFRKRRSHHNVMDFDMKYLKEEKMKTVFPNCANLK